MRFEWDETKNATNAAKHGLRFENAVLVFSDPDAFVLPDERFEYGEKRFVVLGSVCGRVLVVVYVVRDDAVRIISARKANKREVAQYENLRN